MLCPLRCELVSGKTLRTPFFIYESSPFVMLGLFSPQKKLNRITITVGFAALIIGIV